MRYIMDTDMGFDDWLAVLYLLKQPQLDLAGITVDCQGLSRCPEGVVNAAKLVQLSGHWVPVSMGAKRSKSAFDFPKVLRDFSSDMRVPGFAHLKPAPYLTKTSAAEWMVQTVLAAAHAGKKVVIISVGTATNLADAWQLAQKKGVADTFRQGLARIYKGGGAFGALAHAKLSNHHIAGNIVIPGIVRSNNTQAEWNIYANAPAMQTLLAADLPLTFVPNNATDQVNMTQSAYRQLYHHSDPRGVRRFVANAMLSVVELQGGWQHIANNLDFWDTAVTLVALYPALVNQSFAQVPVQVVLKPGKAYAATWIDPASHHFADVDYRLDVRRFYQLLLANL
jgi:pyrimidine-specific ribonucleoside hydrolase